jgi:AmmeMemoRadiSam system protein A/AmmeMemoRadiSam system protein B
VGKIVYGALLPHPPLAIPEIGKGEEKGIGATLAGFKQVAQEMKAKNPDVLVIITPHGPVFSDAVAINMLPDLQGDFSRFGVPGVKIHVPNQLDLVELIMRYEISQGITMAALDEDLIREHGVSGKLDHGTLVPLYYLRQAGLTIPVVHITMGMLAVEELYMFGSILESAVVDSPYTVAIVASGDLSHRLTPNAPAGFNPKGKVFDLTLKKSLEKADVSSIMEISEELLNQAGECGFRPLVMLLGCLDGYDLKTNVISYEGPFGVGYMVASLVPQEKNDERLLLEKLMDNRGGKMLNIRQKESEPVRLARTALETYITTGQTIKAPTGQVEGIPPQGAVFVTLKKHGQLRGCIGTTTPTKASIWEEIIANAIAAGTKDPRFNPVRESELDELTYSVDVLSEPEPVEEISQLDPHQYGVIVSQGWRAGLLLPNLEGIDSAEEQVDIAKKKAGIRGGEVSLKRFTVTRYY